MLVNTLVANHLPSVFAFQPARNLFRAPLTLCHLFFNHGNELGRHFDIRPWFTVSPLLGFGLRLLKAIASFSAITCDFPVNGSRVHPELSGNLPMGVASCLECLNLASLLIGQLLVAFGHEDSSFFVVANKELPQPAASRHLEGAGC